MRAHDLLATTTPDDRSPDAPGARTVPDLLSVAGPEAIA